MVGSTSPRSDSPSVADVASGGDTSSQKTSRSIVIHGHVPNVGRSESRRDPTAGLTHNAWVSRALHAHAGLIADPNNTAASLSGRPALVPSPIPPPSSQPSSQPKAAARAPSAVPVAAITCAAVGGVLVVAVTLALIYFFRIRRRVKRMKRCTDILGPELAPMPMSPSQSSQLSFDSLVKSDGMRILSPSTSDPAQHFLPLAAPIVTPPATVDRPSQPLSPIRISTIIIGPPPTPRRGSVLPPEPRSPLRSPPVTLTWPSPTPQSQYYPKHDQGERRASSD